MTAFADLGLSELACRRSRTWATSSPARSRSRPSRRAPRGARHDRPGADGLGQDRRLRAADDRARRSRPSPRSRRSCSRRRASCASRSRRRCAPTAQRKGVDVVAVFGGAPIRTQQAQLRDGGQVVVGTVGRVLDLIQRASLILHDCRFVVLDEADEMLDLGFLEDVERILAITPNSRQTALFSATMPPPIRELADRYLYDPVTVKVKSETLTVDSVEQFHVDVKPADKAEKLVEVLRAERPDQAIVFVRTKIRCDQLYRKLRDRGMNVKRAARRHVPGPARRRDALVQGRAACRSSSRPTSPPAASTSRPSRTSSTSTSRPRPTSTCTASGAPAASGAPGRAITFVEPRQTRELAAIEKHIGTGDRAVGRGRARRRPRPVAERPRRHSKPQLSRNGDEPQAKLIAGVGRADGVEVADLVHAVTRAAGHRRRGGPRRERARALLLPRRAGAARPSASSTRSTATPVNGTRCASRSRALSGRTSAVAPA